MDILREWAINLYDQNRYAWFMRAKLYLNNEQDAEDILQDVWIELVSKVRYFHAQSDHIALLKTVVRNKCMDLFRSPARKKRVYSSNYESDGRFDDRPENCPEIDEHMLNEQLSQRVLLAVQDLDEKYRFPFIMFHVDGQSYQEIALFLGLHLGTVKTHLHRARAILRDQLAELNPQATT